MDASSKAEIKAIDVSSIHKISSGQVVIDLQTAVKELVENSLDAGATNIEVRFKDYGLESIEVIDNGSGIAPADYDAVALKHHTSKLDTFENLPSVSTFGFRGEALSSLCALSESVTVTTATAAEAPMGTILGLAKDGKVQSRDGKVARQRGTTVTVTRLFHSLPVRRKELERNIKREFGKALTLLNAYALVPCANENKGVRLTCTNQPKNGKKNVQLRTDGSPSTRASVSSLWGPKALENIIDLDLSFEVETEKSVLRRQSANKDKEHVPSRSNPVKVRGLISKFTVGGGRTGTDRQFFYINGRPCTPTKVQKAFNEVYRTFNANQSPFVVADFIIPSQTLDINVSPDKRTIFIHSENNLIQALKVAIEDAFTPSRSTFDMNTGGKTTTGLTPSHSQRAPLFLEDNEDEEDRNSTAEEDTFSLSQPSLLVDLPVKGSTKAVRSDRTRRETSSTLSSRADSPETMDVEEEMPTTRPELSKPTSVFEDQIVEPQSRPSITKGRHSSHNPSNNTVSSDQEMDVDSTDDLPLDPESPVQANSAGINPSHSLAGSKRIRSLSIPSKTNAADTTTTSKVQMVLSTSNASWNLQRPAANNNDEDASDTDSRRGIKRHKTDKSETGVPSRPITIKENLKKRLVGFAMTGSQVRSFHSSDSGDDCEKPEEVDLVQDSEDKVNASSGVDADAKLEPGNVNITRGADIEEEHHTTRPKSVGVIDLTEAEDESGDATSPVPDAETHVTVRSSSTAHTETEIIKTTEGDDISLVCNLTHLQTSWRQLKERIIQRTAGAPSSKCGEHGPNIVADAGLDGSNDHDKAIEALSRVIDKSDFASMQVIGQFNKGFIITRRKTSSPQTDFQSEAIMDDLFIVDQHAADEKYNFEQLQLTTKIDSQPLFRPLPLELTAADELHAAENVDVLRQNGFEINVDDDMDLVGHKLKLVAQPISKDIVFDMKDLEELLNLMHDQPKGRMVRCSKARLMFASRACRMSFMIGMPLKRQQMLSVIRHMGTMDQPWNCPHGRPTMRHLTDIVDMGWVPRISGTSPRAINWDLLPCV
ncbi:hypothetical protein C8Q75DRAFT_845669 [Abortiporus biennis]|nr:hypothetical protein C8Q75DRAFT_845669 [Abortiporus biennis]